LPSFHSPLMAFSLLHHPGHDVTNILLHEGPAEQYAGSCPVVLFGVSPRSGTCLSKTTVSPIAPPFGRTPGGKSTPNDGLSSSAPGFVHQPVARCRQ